MRSLLLLLAWLPLVSCGETAGRPPVPRLVITPAYLPPGDGFATPVVLDGSASKDEIDDPEATRPVRFRWELSGSDLRVEAGGFDQPTVTVRLPGDRPLVVRLIVSDAEGLESRIEGVVGVTIPP